MKITYQLYSCGLKVWIDANNSLWNSWKIFFGRRRHFQTRWHLIWTQANLLSNSNLPYKILNQYIWHHWFFTQINSCFHHYFNFILHSKLLFMIIFICTCIDMRLQIFMDLNHDLSWSHFILLEEVL